MQRRSDGVLELRAAPSLVMRRREGAGWTRVLVRAEGGCEELAGIGASSSLRWSVEGPHGVAAGVQGEAMGPFTDVGGAMCAAWVPDGVLHGLTGRLAPVYVGTAEVQLAVLRDFMGAQGSGAEGVETRMIGLSAGATIEGRSGALEYTVQLQSLVPVSPTPPVRAPSDGRLRVWLSGPREAFGDGTPSLVARSGGREVTLQASFGEGEGAVQRWLFLGPGEAAESLSAGRTLELRVGRRGRVTLARNPLAGLVETCARLERSFAGLEAGLDEYPRPELRAGLSAQ